MKITEPRIRLRRCRYCGALIVDDETGMLHELTCTKRLKPSSINPRSTQ